jgi:hypothetical protein
MNLLERKTAGEGGEKEGKRRPLFILLLAILAVITVVCIGVTVWAVWFRDATPALAPDYAPVQTEEHAEPMGDEEDEKLEQQEGGGAVSLTYSRTVDIDLSEKKATLLFGNPTRSNQDMVLQLVIRNTVIAQSGRLLPGNQVKTLELLDSARLAEGTYEGKFVVLYYQQDTGEKAIVNTEIPLEIHVSE